MEKQFKKGQKVLVISHLCGEPMVLEETVFCVRGSGRISFVGGGGIDASPEEVFPHDPQGGREAYTFLVIELERYALECDTKAKYARKNRSKILESLARIEE